jgi:hypothetical protein
VAAKRRRTGEVRRRAVKRWYEVSGPLPLWIGQGQLKNIVAPVRGGGWRLVQQDVRVFAKVRDRSDRRCF